MARSYDALREGCALGSLGPRRQIAVSGRDRATYLQGLLTNDIVALGPGQGCYSAWLTPQGRMLTDMHVLESGDMVLLDVPADTAEATLQRLDQYLFAEEVQLGSLDGDLVSLWAHGPVAGAVLAEAMPALGKVEELQDYRLLRAEVDGHSVVLARIDQLGVPGFAIYAPPAAREPIDAALRAAGAIEADREAIEALRIEAGYPLFGVDMTEDTIPLEAGIERRAISFTKGCYVGQEVIIRVLHRGHGRVARRLAGLRIDGPMPGRGATLRSGEREVGFVTSAAVSPRLGTIALAYVHRDFVEAGTELQTSGRDGGARAVVSRLPMS